LASDIKELQVFIGLPGTSGYTQVHQRGLDDDPSNLDISRTLRFAFDGVKAAMGVPLDLLILTSREFQERPLPEMDELVPLYAATVSDSEDPPKV
jgi:hypothetical protein